MLHNTLYGFITTIFLATCANAATIFNGSFEHPGNFTGPSLPLGGSSLSGWEISGSIDLVQSLWSPSNGRYSIDLNHAAPASIAQTVTSFTVGRDYILRFDLSGNPNGSPDQAVRVTIGDTSDIFTNRNDNTFDNMMWRSIHMPFTANSPQLRLEFESLTAGPWGVALDNISLSPIPLPASIWSLILSFLLLASLKRGKRRQQHQQA